MIRRRLQPGKPAVRGVARVLSCSDRRFGGTRMGKTIGKRAFQNARFKEAGEAGYRAMWRAYCERPERS